VVACPLHVNHIFLQPFFEVTCALHNGGPKSNASVNGS